MPWMAPGSVIPLTTSTSSIKKGNVAVMYVALRNQKRRRDKGVNGYVAIQPNKLEHKAIQRPHNLWFTWENQVYTSVLLNCLDAPWGIFPTLSMMRS